MNKVSLKKLTKSSHTFIHSSNYYVRKFWITFSFLLFFTILTSIITIIIPIIVKIHIEKMSKISNDFIDIIGKLGISQLKDKINKEDLLIDLLPELEKIIKENYDKDSLIYEIILRKSKLLADELRISFKGNILGFLYKFYLTDDLKRISLEMVGWIIFSILILVLSLFTKEYSGSLFARKIEIDYRIRILEHLLTLDMKFFEKTHSGSTFTKLINDTSTVAQNIREVPAMLINAAATFIGVAIAMFLINWKVASIVIGFTFFILISCSITFSFIKKFKKKERKVYSSLNSYVLDRINIIKLIKANATEKFENLQFKKSHQEYYKIGKKLDIRDSASLAFFISVVRTVSLVSIISLVIFTIAYGDINAKEMREMGGKMLVFIMLTSTLVMPIFQTVSIFSRIIVIIISVERLESILNIKSNIVVKSNSIKLNKIENGIKFENVGFSYLDDNFIFQNLSFHFKPNHSYAIVGETGSGKTTITKLILRFYDPQKGSIKINGHDLRDLDLESFLNNVGYIEQEPNIFSGTFLDNIRYSKFNATLDEVKEAAKKANIHDFIMSTSNQYDSEIGENGFILSGGQKQRILIARIFLKNPQILIMDEATSSLDNIIEKQIQKQLNLLMKNRTTIIIAHRLSTIQNVDQILVLSKGKSISQIGTFQELVNTPGHFKNLYEAGLISKK